MFNGSYFPTDLGPCWFHFILIHSFILNIYIAPLQENYSEARVSIDTLRNTSELKLLLPVILN